MFARRTTFAIALLLSIITYASEAAYLHYTIDEGLPSNEVYDIYEDSSGYMWFATDHGISRYDGYEFKNYSTADGLVHNTIFGFYEDHRGLIWMRSFNSQLCYMQNGVIKPYRHNAQLQAFLKRDFIQRYAFDLAGNLWFVPIRTNLGLFFQDAISGEIKQVDLPDGYNGFVRILDSGEILAGIDNNNGYTGNDIPNDTVLSGPGTWYFQIPRTSAEVRRELINCVQTGEEQFVFSYDMNLLTLEKGVVTHRRSYNEIVNRMYIDQGKQVWLCMNGFYRCIPGISEQAPFLGNELATCMKRDRLGNHWFSTIASGIYLARDVQVSVLKSVAGYEVDELSTLQTFDSFLVVMDADSRFFMFPHSQGKPNVGNAKSWASSFTAINTFCIDETQHRLHLKGFYYDLDIFGVNTNSEQAATREVHPTAIRDYWHDGDSILIAGNNTWAIMDSTARCVYTSSANDFRRFCTAIARDEKRTIWIGTSDGLYIFSGDKTIPYRPDDSLFRQRVTDIGFTKHGDVIVSTRGGGVLMIVGDTTYEIRAANGLASDQCGNVLVDDSVVWVCSNSGLTKVIIRWNGHLPSFSFERYSMQHGLPSDQVNDVTQISDQLFLATGHGLCWFDVNEYRFNRQAPPVYINAFQVNDRELSLDSSSLLWSDRNITIGFIGLLYKSPGLVHYRYKLEGYETDWNYTTDRIAHYYNLPAGAYRFVVSAMNENGIWNDIPAVKQFEIPQHFTEALWFLCLVYGLIILVLGSVAGLYFRQQRLKAKTALQLALAEQKALRAQMKPHFIFNALNSIQNFIINRDDDSAQLYLTSFAQLMRRVLDQSRVSSITLEEEIETLRLYLDIEKLRFGKEFNYRFLIGDGISTGSIYIPPLLIQPFVENAIWHGLQMKKEHPLLTIAFEIENGLLKAVIEDNGIGRKRAAELRKKTHVSTGLKNVDERVAVLNATSDDKISVTITDLSDAEGNPTGTRVEILFPVDRNDGD